MVSFGFIDYVIRRGNPCICHSLACWRYCLACLRYSATGHPTINEPLTKTDIVLQPRAEMRIGSQPEPLSVIQAREDEISYL
jgi:hypothetical protein